jgi:lambda family phage tail tape measure protein
MSTTTLRIGVDGRPAQLGSKEVIDALKAIETQAKRTADLIEDKFGEDGETGQQVEGLGSKVDKVKEKFSSLAGIIAALGFGALLGKIIETNVEFQRLEANLKTVTGSAMGAKAAFAELQKFAASTPFSLRGLTDAFTTLKLAGVDTSARALTAFGNIASSFGRDITELAIAVKSAMAGEMEALSAFGPKVLVEGDKFKVTFQGVTKEIKRDARELEKYLIELGETRFAGGMANQMQTLAGQWSNFGDNLDRLQAKIGEGGLNAALARLLEYLNRLTSTGDVTAKQIGAALGQAVDFLTSALKFLIENFDILLFLMKAFITAKVFMIFGELASAVWAAAKGTQAFTAALAKNPFGLIATILAVIIAYLADYLGLLGIAVDETKRLKEENERVLKQFKEADQSSLESVLANATAIADEMHRTNDEMIEAGENTAILAQRMLVLKAIEEENLDKALTFIASMSAGKAEEIITQEMGLNSSEDELDLKAQLAVLKTQRDQLKSDLLKAGIDAQGAIDLKDKGIEYQNAFGQTVHEDIQLEPDKIREFGAEALKTFEEADRVMRKISEIEGKLGKDTKKTTEKASEKAAKAAQAALEKMREGIAGLESDAAAAAFEVEALTKFADPLEAEKAIAFRKEYNKLTKDGTIPLTLEEEARIKKATDALIDLKKERERIKFVQSETAKLTQQVEDSELRLRILSDDTIADKEQALALAQYEARLISEGVTDRADLLALERKRLDLAQEIRQVEAFADRVAGLDKRIAQAKEQLRLVGATAREKFVEAEITAATVEAEKTKTELTAEQLRLIREKAGTIYDITQQVEAETNAIEKQGKALKEFLNENDFETFMTNLEELGISAIDGLSNALADFLITGEADWESFFQGLAKDITALIIKLLIAQAIAAGINALFPGAGTAAVSTGGLIGAAVRHSGGYTSALTSSRLVPSAVFAGAPRYAAGRIPGIGQGEQAAILHEREAVVPLPDGRRIPVDLNGEGSKAENHYHSWNLPGVKNPEEFRKTTRQLENEFNARMKRLKGR